MKVETGILFGAVPLQGKRAVNRGHRIKTFKTTDPILIRFVVHSGCTTICSHASNHRVAAHHG